MEVSKITGNVIQPQELILTNKTSTLNKESDRSKNSSSKTLDFFDKKVSFLTDSLDNNLQMENNHPLGRADYRPIDTLQEAKSLLSYFFTPEYKNSASGAQANVTPESFLTLFAD